MLLHLAIGDAYGAGFEYAPAALVGRHNDLSGYIQHPKHREVLPGSYTDDTQMSVAVAEVLLESERPEPLQWANRFVECFRRDPRHGYARRFYDFLTGVRDGAEFLERIRPQSAKSGAAMRSLPIGWLADPDRVQAVAAEQAQLTHDTAGGVQSAQAVALTAHFFLYARGGRAELGDYLSRRLGGSWLGWQGPVGAAGVDAVRAALTALVRHRSLSALLRACVAYTGDVDTVASIALGAAVCAPETRLDLPPVLYADLENGPYGSDYLQQLQARLSQRFPKARLHSSP